MTPMEFSVLGPVRAWRAGAELDLGPPQQRAALAFLLVHPGQPVALSELVGVLWGDDPPTTAVNVLHRYIGRLRRLFEPDLPLRASGRWLLRSAGGYRLQVDEESADLPRFRRLVEQGRLSEALKLRQGPCAMDIDAAVRAHPAFAAVEHEYIGAVQDLADTSLSDGTALSDGTRLSDSTALSDGPAFGAITVDQALSIVQQAAADHPWDESLQARQMLLLAAGDRPAEALRLYRAVAQRLADEHGIDPGAELQAAYQQIPRPDADPPAEPDRPAQLPPDLPIFTGRDAELARAFEMLGDGTQPPPAVVISAIDGMAGIGKTTLAVHWAHQVAGRFPDGQLYVNLRGFDPSGAALDPSVAVRGFLEALGVPPKKLPATLDDQAALFRSLVAGRRILVLLDNARDVEQVRPLLPGSAGCLVIVTSRNRLAGLVTRDGALPLTLDLLGVAEARESLAARLGPERVAAEPAAVEQIIAACGRLPLALVIVAARAAVHPDLPLAALAAELRDAAGSLDAFSDEDPKTDARVVFSWSYHALTAEAARLFRLLALYPGPEIGVPAGASLAGVPVRLVRPLLAELARAHLINERVPGRYSFHDLLRAYAYELLGEDEAADRQQAQVRILDHYLHTTFAANRLVEPQRDPIPLPATADGVTRVELTGPEAAQAWFTVEYAVLLAAVRQAAELGHQSHAWQLAWTMHQFFDRRGLWHDWMATQRIALDAAERQSDRIGIAYMHRGIGTVYSRLSRSEDAYAQLDLALELFGELGDQAAQANVHLTLGAVKSRGTGRHEEAREHSRQALMLYTLSGQRVGQARALNNLGYSCALLGDYSAALEHCQAALFLQQTLDDRHGQAGIWDSIGFAHHGLGHYQESVAAYERALAMFTELGNRYFCADTGERLGDVHNDQGEVEKARWAWQQALNILQDLDHADSARVRRKLLELDPPSS